jgi:sulfoacetaldehyde dehydrogenase
MREADLVVATGSQNNVREAYHSGTPAIGVGLGNVPVVVDESADLDDAARKICMSKTFDNATSCSSENSVILLNSIYDSAVAALVSAGGYLVTTNEKARIEQTLWKAGKLNRDLIARDISLLIRKMGIHSSASEARFLMVEESEVGHQYPLSGEKLSVVLTIYRARDFKDAKRLVKAILNYQGRGHSCGIHTRNLDHANELAAEIDVVRVLVNQAHAFGNGGSFDNGLNFTLSMGCGTWGKNSISENLNYKHFLNITHLVMPISEDKPTEADLFGPYLARWHNR